MSNFETVIGIEVHVELATKTKIFCSCPTDFGAQPNTHVCPVCMGMPGALPTINRTAVEYAAKAGLATGCKVANLSKLDRKNFFYPDLPKAYQISQFDLPLCTDGAIETETEGGRKSIGVTRIHIEEDAGKLIHGEQGTMIDFNRCGVPLIEIVSEPDMRSAAEAVAYLKKLRAVMLYIGISDCRMNEGSFRADVNLSVHRPDEPFGTRTEIKNLNSFQAVTRAVEYESKRQIEAIERGEEIEQQTRRYDANTGKTYAMRRKETQGDYRFFPEPDIPPIVLSYERIAELRAEIPELPDERKHRYIEEYGLKPYDAEMLVGSRAVADWFERTASLTEHRQSLANLVLTEVFRLINDPDVTPKISPEYVASIVEMSANGRINGAVTKRVLNEVWETGTDPERIVKEQNLETVRDPHVLEKVADEVIAANEKTVGDYLRGKIAARTALIGRMMHATNGRGDPQAISDALDAALDKLKQ